MNTSTYTLKIGARGTFQASSLAEVSAIYERERDASGEGASDFPAGTVSPGKLHVSYNGKVWASRAHVGGGAPLYVPGGPEASL
jgi:hypothetical protein